MNSEKSINSFHTKNEMLPDYLSHNYYLYLFVNNNLELLLFKINVLDIFNMVDFLKIFVVSRSTEIMMQLNFSLRMYVPSIFKIFFNNYNFRQDKKLNEKKRSFVFPLINASTTHDVLVGTSIHEFPSTYRQYKSSTFVTFVYRTRLD